MSAETTPMTDAELVSFLGLEGYSQERVYRFIAELGPEKRALYERMHDVQDYVNHRDMGIGGPPPEGVLFDWVGPTLRRWKEKTQ